MRAIILAAGRGSRLQQTADGQLPKCLLTFGGRSLLERHLGLLEAAGVEEIVLALGFRHDLITAELARLGRRARVEIVLNPRYELGSMLTVHTAAEPLTRGGDVLLMDADVLYDGRIMTALTAGRPPVQLLVSGVPVVTVIPGFHDCGHAFAVVDPVVLHEVTRLPSAS